MRITFLTLAYVSVLPLTGCKDQASQPASSTQTPNAINSITLQSQQKSDDVFFEHIKEQEARDAENWKKSMNIDKLKNRTRKMAKAY